MHGFTTSTTNEDNFGEWRDVPGYEGKLMVSYNGFIMQFKEISRCWLAPKKQQPNHCGYVVLLQDRKHLKVHTLVALAFLGPRPSSNHTVDHIDRNRSNNVASNLRWATKDEQMENREFVHRRAKLPMTERLPGEVFRKWSKFISVSQFGRIKRKKSGAYVIEKPMLNTADYAKISKNRKSYQFHRAVAYLWPDIVGVQPSEKHTVDHIDRDRSNNAASNLRWATPSEQALNRNRPEKRSAAQIVDQVAIEIAKPCNGSIHWIKYDSLCSAARDLSEKISSFVSHNQIGQIVSEYPEGYTATKGILTGWSFRLYNASNDAAARPAKKAKVVRNQTPMPVDVKAPGSDEWKYYASSLAASKGIFQTHGIKINQGSISRFVLTHPNGHTVSAKQNAGWSFRLHQ